MNAHKIILLITAGTIASTASARDRKLDIDVQIKTQAPQLAASMDQSHFLIRNRQYGLAVDVLRKIIRTQPENASAYSAIAVAYDGLGRPDLARKNFEMALAYAPLEERHYRNLARHLNTSGEIVLARNIMNDFEIARVQKASENVKAIPVPVLDITAVLTRLDSESVPDFPNNQPDIPENERSGIATQNVRIAAKASRTIEPVASGNGEDDLTRGASGATSSGAGTNHVISLTTIDDVDDSISEIYAGLGIAIAAPESNEAVPNDDIGKSASQSKIAVVVDSRENNRQADNAEFVTNMDVWLRDLSKRRPDIAGNSQLVENQDSLKSKATEPNVKSVNFQLVRQSLGQVLLTSTNADWQVSKPFRSAGLISNGSPKGLKIETAQNNANDYFAAVRSIFDNRENRIAVASSEVLRDLALKQLDLAMTDLAKKRHSRLPRIDQGPSPQLRQIAVTLYKEADAARRTPLQPAKQNLRVALFYRTATACAV
jgi:hypothetical protein